MIIASSNKNKILQFKEIMPNYNLIPLKEANIEVHVEETGATFEENSYIKARAIYNLTKDSVVADDSGLCIHLYDNWPGVETHRFLGESTSTDRNRYILNRMKDVEYKDRGCTSVCVITMIDKSGKAYTFRGELFGHISTEIKGFNTFGYDDIFELDNGKTMAELSNEEKYKVSARANALSKLKEFLEANKDIEL